MGNACGGLCSEGGSTKDNELKNYESHVAGANRPVNQSFEGKSPYGRDDLDDLENTFDPNNLHGLPPDDETNEDKLLLAYTSGNQQKVIRMEQNQRGLQTRKRLQDGSQQIATFIYKEKAGILQSVQDLRVDDTTDDSAIYTGQILKDSGNVKSGYGIMRWPDGTVYQGLWDKNLYNGRGKLYHASGDLYEGEFIDDMAQGFGIYKHANGSKYVGYWNQDKQHGFGKEKWNDGSQYQGFYQNASKEGQGEYCWPDGNTYIGEWRNNMLNGKGLFFWHDDRLYLGDWQDNMMHGEGTYRWGDGRMFIGCYEDDRKSGLGIYLWADGRAYHGNWKNGKQDGIGYYIVPDGQNTQDLKVKKGIWVNGKRQEWTEEISQSEILQQKQKYSQIIDRTQTIHNDIAIVQKTINDLVLLQLGAKPNQFEIDENEDGFMPLERIVMDALDSDQQQYQKTIGLNLNELSPISAYGVAFSFRKSSV